VAAVSDLVAWAFHSPRRLLGVLVVVLAIIVGVGAVLQSARSPDRTGTAPSASAPAVLPDTGPAISAALTFATAWASQPASTSAEQWRQGLEQLVTPELAKGLALTDPAQLPGGRPQGQPTVRFVSTSSALIQVPLSTGRSVLVTVVLAGSRWLVSDVQPFTGDLGDVPTPASAASPAPSISA
jgi:hypothetical protein